jgi:hypothetical protein
MSLSSWRSTAEWCWVLLGQGDCLHAVGSIVNDAEEDWQGDGFTACGREGSMFIPGLFTRMGAPRCKQCCKLASMPEGTQSPKNVDECRPIVEARLAALVAEKESA